MKKLFVLALMSAAGMAQAETCQCKVYCLSPSGTTVAELQASSKSDAAQKVDKQSDQICRDAGHGRSTSSTMNASQCWVK